MPQAGVQLKLDRSGRATVFCGCSDIGQGVDSVLAYIVCEELGLELRDVRVVAADTDLTPVDLGSYSSRETFMVRQRLPRRGAHAARAGGGHARRAVGRAAPTQVVLARGVACATSDPGDARMSVREAFQAAEARHGTLGSVGWYQTPRSSAATTAAAPSAPRRPTRSPRTSPRWSAIPRPAS